MTVSTTSNSVFNSNHSPQPLLVIPGPIQYHPSVLKALGEQTLSHTSSQFINEFGNALNLIPKIFKAGEGAQAFILNGSGTIGWDIALSNFCEKNDLVFLPNTGYFSDSVVDCAQAYEMKVKQIKAKEIGDTVPIEEFSDELKKCKPRMVVLTQVDTSTAVLNDIEAMCKVIKETHPEALICVDGVCSIGGEKFEMEKIGCDIALCCSQKALGAPPGLCVLCISARALHSLETRSSQIRNYYANLKHWLPIMRAYQSNQPSYFSTPGVNLIRALNRSLELIEKQGVEKRWLQHSRVSKAFKAAAFAMGLKQVPTSEKHAANTLSAFYFPEGVEGPKLLQALARREVIAAGGLHKLIKAKYFRVGTMGESVFNEDILIVVQVLEEALIDLGVKLEKGKARRVYEDHMKQ